MNIRRNLALLLLALIPFSNFVSVTRAEEISIVGNGSESVNQASVSSTTEATITQTNQANITNNVATTADTGNNSASSNNGSNTTIETGNITANTTITNSGNNDTVNTTCCPTQNLSVNVEGNGGKSVNTANLNLTSNTTVLLAQTANITNNITGVANTGGNSADQNSGNVSIGTGNIQIKGNISNTHINEYLVSVPISDSLNLITKISGNAPGSLNKITVNSNSTFSTLMSNLANISNILNWDANTGKNSADKNTGDVNIKTGDIWIDLSINNDKINEGKVIVTCCPTIAPPSGSPTPTPTPPTGSPNPTPTPTSPPDNNPGPPGPGSPSPSGGAVLGAVAGAVLPATGGYWSIILTLLSILLFTYGLVLRLSPTQQSKPRKPYKRARLEYNCCL